MKLYNRIFVLVTILLTAMISCTNLVYTGPVDIVELQSVWQYLKVYSIYQDRVPQDPYVYDTPEQLFETIHDTLKGSNYTHYASIFPFKSAQIANSDAGSTNAGFSKLTDSTCLIRIANFETGIYQEFLPYAQLSRDYHNIIIDLRSNPGGNLDELDSIISCFLPLDTPYINALYRDYTWDNHTARTVGWAPWRSSKEGFLASKHFAVLIDGYSASASEIFAAGLKDAAGAYLVGERSYGKGRGQIKIARLHRDTIQITYLKIKGLTNRTGEYDEIGIAPDDIPAEIVSEGRVYANLHTRQLFYALKLLEPSTPPIVLPLLKIGASNLSKSGGFKIVNEQN